jgi:Flp pilus assembly protein TadD
VKLGGALLYGKRDADGAITELRKAIGFDPKNALAYIHLGRCLLEKGDRTGAMAALLTGLELEPNVLNYNNVAMLLAAGPDGVRDGKRAVELATRACELTDWKDPVILDTLAAAYAEVGDFDKAVEYQKKALSFPTFPKAEEAGGRARLDLYANKRPYRDPALAPREVAPPPREVK